MHPESSTYVPETPDKGSSRKAGGPESGGGGDAPIAIVFKDAAARKVKELIEEEGNPALKLRVFVAGGGCSGFQYGFTFDEEIAEDDYQFEKFGVKMLVDAMSSQYLNGAEIDYQEKLEGSQFIIHNPNVKSTCGCGSSFSV